VFMGAEPSKGRPPRKGNDLGAAQFPAQIFTG